MNLQPAGHKKDSDEDQETWRNSHTIRFSHIDGAGIVYYPRYMEMLADSFPKHFSARHPARFDISFHHPVRLGEMLHLELEAATTNSQFTVSGRSADERCFRLHKSSPQAADVAHSPHDTHAFVRQVEIRDWMTGANGSMHLSRSYELTAVLMEEWFSTSLQCPFATTQSSDGVLVPTVKLQTDIHAMPCLGDIVQTSLVVTHIGGSSLGLEMTVRQDGKLLLQTLQTIVFVALQNNQLHSVQIPPRLLPILNSQLMAAKA